MEKKLTHEEFDNFIHNTPRTYDVEKEYQYPGKNQLLKVERIGATHGKRDLIIDKIMEQVLHDVVCQSKGVTSRVLQFRDEEGEEEQQKRKYSTRTKDPSNKVTCAYCNEKFKNKNSLKSHVSKAKGTKCSRDHATSGLSANLEERQEICL